MQKWIELADQVKMVIKDYSQLRLSHGRKVFEIRPTIKWDKGSAVEFLLESLGDHCYITLLHCYSFDLELLADVLFLRLSIFLGYEESNDVLPIYIGDDRTDEDAFRVSFDDIANNILILI